MEYKRVELLARNRTGGALITATDKLISDLNRRTQNSTTMRWFNTRLYSGILKKIFLVLSLLICQLFSFVKVFFFFLLFPYLLAGDKISF